MKGVVRTDTGVVLVADAVTSAGAGAGVATCIIEENEETVDNPLSLNHA